MLDSNQPALISISTESFSITEAHERNKFFPFDEEELQLLPCVSFINCSPKVLQVFRGDFDKTVKFLQAVMHLDLSYQYTPFPVQ